MPLKPTFWLHFSVLGDGTEWIEKGLPIPNYLEHNNRGYDIAWQVEGYFGTLRSIEYLNDIIARVLVTFRDNNPKRLPWKPDLKSDYCHYYPKIRKMRELSALASLQAKKDAPARADSFADFTFWAIKLYIEDEIRKNGEGVPVPYPQLLDWAYSQFYKHKKGLSTVKAKCVNVWKWNDRRDWTLPKRKRKTKDDRELLMTRQERALKNAEARQEEARNKIINAVTGLMSEIYKKVNGNWHIGKIAEATNLSSKTVSKHLKELGYL